MPVVEGSNQKAINENIKRLISENKPRREAVAISLEMARRASSNNDESLNQLEQMKADRMRRKLDLLGITEEMIEDEIKRLENPPNAECYSRFV